MLASLFSFSSANDFLPTLWLQVLHVCAIVYKKTRVYIEWQSDNRWQRVVQRLTTNSATSDSERENEWQRVTSNDNMWQRMTTTDNDWYNEWQRMVLVGLNPKLQSVPQKVNNILSKIYGLEISLAFKL